MLGGGRWVFMACGYWLVFYKGCGVVSCLFCWWVGSAVCGVCKHASKGEGQNFFEIQCRQVWKAARLYWAVWVYLQCGTEDEETISL